MTTNLQSNPGCHDFTFATVNSIDPAKNLILKDVSPIESALLLTNKFSSKNSIKSELQREITPLDTASHLKNALDNIYHNIMSLMDNNIYLSTLNLEKILIRINTTNVNLRENKYDVECEYQLQESVEDVRNMIKTKAKYGLDTFYQAVDILFDKIDHKNLIRIANSLYAELPTKIIDISLEGVRSSSESMMKIIVFNELSKIIKDFIGPNAKLTFILKNQTISLTSTEYVDEKNQSTVTTIASVSSIWSKESDSLYNEDKLRS